VSPEDRAADGVRRLAEEVREELARVEVVKAELARLAGLLTEDCPPDTRMSAAGHLHSFYTGCEAVLSRIARALDEMPEGDRWHQALLAQAAAGREGRRPPIISAETFAALLELLRFRHFFRVAYGVELVPGRLRANADVATGVHDRFRAEVGAFLAALEAAARS
jgi:hypothetical protein